MNEKVLHTLEYNKILDQLTEYAFSADAKSRCQKLRPITDRAQIEQLQQQTSDALSRLFKYGSLSFSGVTDIRDSLKRLEIGGALSAIELLRVCSLLESAKRAKAFARSQEDNDQPVFLPASNLSHRCVTRSGAVFPPRTRLPTTPAARYTRSGAPCAE